jgi:hypothetical protein
MRYIVRSDGSTFHTYFFDVDSGVPKFGNTPKDNVVYWDFDFADGSGEPPEARPEAREVGPRNNESALLLHGTQNRTTNAGVDEANLSGDYFYLEALTRLKKPDWTPYW